MARETHAQRPRAKRGWGALAAVFLRKKKRMRKLKGRR